MKTDQLQLTEHFDSDAETLYNAWLNSHEHSRFTGGTAVIAAYTGSKFSAWERYITGTILGLEPHKRILHAWRTQDFPKGSADSMLEVIIEDKAEGCQLTLKHWNIPEGQGENYRIGWEDHYFAPMKLYFARQRAAGVSSASR